jgi:hypothetical protein
MNAASRPISAGKTRQCPHCKATILESLSICPGCLHHIRYDKEAARRQDAAKPALRVEGIVAHPGAQDPWEYYVVVAVRNERGEEVSRHVMSVGALHSGEKRAFSLSVEVLPLQVPPPPKPAAVPERTPVAAGAALEPPKPRVGGYDLKPPGLKPKKT